VDVQSATPRRFSQHSYRFKDTTRGGVAAQVVCS
jgi:hypothetical protein